MNLIDLPEEIILLILVRLDLASVAAIEATCRRLRKVIADARYEKDLSDNLQAWEVILKIFKKNKVFDVESQRRPEKW